MERELEIIGKRDTRKRRSRPDMKRAPFRYVCDLEYDFRSIGRKPWMTGFLVGPSTVLTAGHLIDGVLAFDGSFDAKRVRAIPGRRGTYKPFGSVNCTGHERPSNYSVVTSTDYMLLFLDDDVGNDVGYWSYDHEKRAFDRTGTSTYQGGGLPRSLGRLKVNLSGYPDDKPPGSGCGTSGHRCNFTFADDPKRGALCGTFQYSSFDETVRFEDDAKLLLYENDTCSGHSGSPVWIRRHSSKGGRVLVGVHIGSSGPDANVAVFMHDQLRSYLRSHAR